MPNKLYSVRQKYDSWEVVNNLTGKIATVEVSERAAMEAARYFSNAETGSMTKDFKSSHFDEPNILAHVRFNERTTPSGGKVLFIEEIQSDWAQKGKKEGFKDDYGQEEYL